MSAQPEQWFTPTESTATVLLSGDIDHRNAPDLVGRVTGVVSRGARRVVVDLDAVEFLDAAALGALVRARNLSRPLGADIRVRCSNRRLKRLFTIAGLEALLTTDD
jgi:anti-sigma B factor antagonist